MITESNKLESTIIQLHKNELPKVTNADVIAMANVIKKLEETTANLPSKKVNEVVDQLKNFMETLALSDCELFARDVRRMMDNLIEVKQSKNENSDNYSDILKEITKNHSWLPSSTVENFQNVNAMKEILNTLNSVGTSTDSNNAIKPETEIEIEIEISSHSSIGEVGQWQRSLLKKIEEISNRSETPSINTDVEKRLTSLEEKIEKLLNMIDANFIPGINTLLEVKGE
jgi:energy-coupling factor transporter ATP-binding protein EcfA2